MFRRLALLAALTLSIAGPSTAGAHPSVSVVMDTRGNVFYSDLYRVWIVTPDGRKSIAVPNVHSHELFVDPAGNLYGEHLWYEGKTKKWGHRVWKRTPEGTITDVIAPQEGFRSDYSFVRDAQGNMYYPTRVGPREIRKRSESRPSTVFSRGPFTDIRWMVTARDGGLYLIDAGDLKRVWPNGTVTPVAGGLGSRSLVRLNVGKRYAVMGLWLDSAQNVYAARYGAGDVKRISREGTVTTVAHSTVPWGPTGGMTAPNGDLYILENSVINEVRLKRISKDGTVRYY